MSVIEFLGLSILILIVGAICMGIGFAKYFEAQSLIEEYKKTLKGGPS